MQLLSNQNAKTVAVCRLSKIQKAFSNILVGGKAHTNEYVNGLTLMMKCHFIHEQIKRAVQKHLNINFDKSLSIPMQRSFEVIIKNHS